MAEKAKNSQNGARPNSFTYSSLLNLDSNHYYFRKEHQKWHLYAILWRTARKFNHSSGCLNVYFVIELKLQAWNLNDSLYQQL